MSETKLQLSLSSLSIIRDEAKAAPEEEVCGLVLLVGGEEVVWPCENVYPDKKEGFRLSPVAMSEAHDKGTVIAVYHSHPFRDARPSKDFDLVACEVLNLPYVIYSPKHDGWSLTEPSGWSPPLIGRRWCGGLLDCYTLIQDYFAALRECRDCGTWWCIRMPLAVCCPKCESTAFGPQVFDFPYVERGDYLFDPSQGPSKLGALYMDYVPQHGWVEIPEEMLREHDGILMKFVSCVTHHAAIYLGDSVILHHPQGQLSSREGYGAHWRQHKTHTCRHEKLLRQGDLWRPLGSYEWQIFGK